MTDHRADNTARIVLELVAAKRQIEELSEQVAILRKERNNLRAELNETRHV